MTRDDIIKLAREANVIDFRDEDDDEHVKQMIDMLEHVVAQAAAAEREACAKVCEAIFSPSRLSDPGRSWITGTMDCAAAIRARSQA